MVILKAVINIQNMKKDDLSLNIRHNLGTLYFHNQIDICIFPAFVAACKQGAISTLSLRKMRSEEPECLLRSFSRLAL